MMSGAMVCEGVCVFLLMVLAAPHHTVEAAVRRLDMAPDAVDDDFSECGEKMLQVVTDDLLRKELGADGDFRDLWRQHSGTCMKTIPGGTALHMTALQAYGNSRDSFRKRFNSLVYSRGTNSTTYQEGFPFKSLHFLLTESLRLLKPKVCTNVYFATSNKYSADPGAEVRFGKFLKAEVSRNSAMNSADVEDGGTLFNITSCSVVKVEDHTCKCEELQCLISPAEVFKVQKVQEVSSEGGGFNEITLTYTHFLSNHHCSFFQRNSAGVVSSVCLTFTLLMMMFCLLSAGTM